jgi:catechol 2,3-dioxygenase-like lactoylglutathione lyase family enzyme
MQQKQDPIWVQDNLLKVQLAEYSALRAEISSFHSIEHMSISFAIAAFAAVVGLIIKTGVSLDEFLRSPATHKPDIALIASPFLFLGFFFGYSQIRIVQVAAYLNLRLRPQIVQLLGDAALEWESYRRSPHFPQGRLSALLSWCRWLLFVWPLVLLFWCADWSWGVLPMDRLLYIEIIGFLLLIWFGVYCSWSLPKQVAPAISGSDAGFPLSNASSQISEESRAAGSYLLGQRKQESLAGAKAALQIRFARPTDKLEEVISFYRDGLGMPMIGHFENHAGYSGVMLGMPNEQVHVEFTRADAGSPCPAPTKDNLLVIYMPDMQMYWEALKHMRDQGHASVAPENPYWKDKSETFEDPDGWRVVLYNGEAFSDRT